MWTYCFKVNGWNINPKVYFDIILNNYLIQNAFIFIERRTGMDDCLDLDVDVFLAISLRARIIPVVTCFKRIVYNIGPFIRMAGKFGMA